MDKLYIGQFKGYADNSSYGVFNVYFQYNASGITLSNMSIKLSKDVDGKYTTNDWFIDSVSIGGSAYNYSPTSGSANYNTAGAGPTINISGTHASGSSVYVEVKMHRTGQGASAQKLSGTITGLATAPTGLWCNISERTETTVSISGGYTSDGGSGVTTSGYQYSTNGSTWYNCSSYISGLSPGTTYYFRYYAGNAIGTSYSGNASTTTYNYPAITSAPNLTIGDQLTIGFSNPRGLTCYVYLILDDGNEYGGDNTTGTYISGYNDDGWLAHWYNSIPKSKSGSYKVRLYVPDVGRNTTVNGGTYSIKNNGTEIPNFSDSNWIYSANLTQLTNNNQCIINGYSEIAFSVNTAATSSYGSPIAGYNYKWGNQSNGTGTVSKGNGNILEVAAIDSRGLSKSTSKTLSSGTNYVPYTTPILDYSNSYTQRVNGIAAETHLTLQGNLSVMKFGSDGIANAIHSCKYKVYNYNTGVWSDEFTIPVSEISLNSSGYFSLNNYMIHANGSSGGFTVGVRYGIQIILQDANGLLGTLTSNLIQITDGKIARDVYQDGNGDYHQGINGLANENYNNIIYGKENITDSLYINGDKKLDSTTINKELYVGNTGKQLKNIKSNQELVDLIYPVGSIYLSINNTNPGTLFGGTWEQIKDRFLLACGSTYNNGSTGGSATHIHSTGNHTLTVDEMPSHNHPGIFKYTNQSGGWYARLFLGTDGKQLENEGKTGGGKPHNHGNTGSTNHMPPYLAVYMWKRTA